ncbi:Ribosomal protein L18 [Giardia muris]|uniref:Ribosomal protein L18 n=1 Tax=Giardia muris TaxID=5742 RepID=A0A4Z1SXQ3_GIAMU|nr:Ribosomal protein L18 [Giardia muris]|eukprot:TNJ29595.1 Ribosomal protein L18 [Giardia muris]
MGIDLKTGLKRRPTTRKTPKAKNPYIGILHEAFKTLHDRSGSEFTDLVARRLALSRTNRPPVSVSRLAKYMRKAGDKIAVIASTITNDERFNDVPKMNVCALRFTATARSRIEKAGGRCMTFDQLLAEKPTGEGCIVLQGSRKARKAYKYFGAAGLPGSKTKPKGVHKGRKGARGRHSW